MKYLVEIMLLALAVTASADKRENIDDKLDRHYPTPRVVTRPAMSEAIHWTINNADASFGKSLTGLSDTRLNSDYKPTHIKVGVVSGRMGVLKEIKREELRKFGILDDWRKSNHGIVFGIHIVKEF